MTVNFWVSNHSVLENGEQYEKYESFPTFFIYFVKLFTSQNHPKQNERKQNIIRGP